MDNQKQFKEDEQLATSTHDTEEEFAVCPLDFSQIERNIEDEILYSESSDSEENQNQHTNPGDNIMTRKRLRVFEGITTERQKMNQNVRKTLSISL
jgi:hypothetical protein